MPGDQWTITFRVFRQKDGQPAHYENFEIQVNPDEYVLDGIERIWAFHDRSLVFRHACHHSACGACGMRVNGAEKLTCITPIREVTRNGGTLKIDPLANFPVVSDLVVDMSLLYQRMEMTGYSQVVTVNDSPAGSSIHPPRQKDERKNGLFRLADCIECGMCISACPVALTSREYLGPAVLAAIQVGEVQTNPTLAEMANSKAGVWRCHSAYECTEVCPSFVEPGWRIMDLRREIILDRVRRLFWTQTRAHERPQK